MTFGYPIFSKELTSNAGIIIASNLPQGYTDLYIVISAKGAGTGSTDWLSINFNGQTESNKTNYSRVGFYGSFGNAQSADTHRMWGEQYPTSDTASFSQYEFSTILMQVTNYSNTNIKKQIFMQGGKVGLTPSTTGFLYTVAGQWDDTSAITQIHFTPDAAKGFKSGTTIDIYGTKRVGQ